MANDIAVFKTNMGTFKVKLYLEKSPITAGNFKQLVESGFYNETKFHRVLTDFMIQGGDPLSKNDNLKKKWGTGGAERIKDEFIRGLSNVRGSLSMANSGPNSGSSQFFINTVNNDFLDWDKGDQRSKHPVFGEIIAGMDVIDNISIVKVGRNDIPEKNITISSAFMESAKNPPKEKKAA